MIISNGKIIKKTYCNHCFSILTWDSVDDEIATGAHKRIKCPYCGAQEDIEDGFETIETGIIEEPKAYVDGRAYATTAEALANLKDGDKIKIEEDITVTSLNLPSVEVDFNGHTVKVTNSIVMDKEVTLSNGTIQITNGSQDAIIASEGAIVILNDMDITSKRNGVTSTGGKIILNDSSINAQEAAILALDGGSIEINGGTYTTVDNGPIMTNGTAGRGNNEIVINGGTFTGHITSAGYLAFVAYLANTDSLTVKGGTFNVENGSAFIVRGGRLTIGPDVVINASGDATGKVGDGALAIPAGHDIVVDYKSQYPAVESIKINAPDRDIFVIEAE